MPDPIALSYSLPYYFAALIFGYLLGSTPFGLLLTRFAGLGDVRKIGSGNIGATNVLRTGNKKLAALTLLGDMLKGTLAVVIAAQWGNETATLAGTGAFLGHIFPLWLKFKGGKGVATYIGILLGFCFSEPSVWLALALFAFAWLSCAYFTRYSSLSALVATGLMPFVLIGLGVYNLSELFAVLSALLWIKHKTNINRLLSGTESKIGADKAPHEAKPAAQYDNEKDQDQ